MHPSLSKAELHYGDYGLQNHGLHHDSMYYNPPVYQVQPQHNNTPQPHQSNHKTTNHHNRKHQNQNH